MPESTNDEPARDINVPSKDDELREKVKTIIVGFDNGKRYDSKTDSILQLIHQHTEQVVREADWRSVKDVMPPVGEQVLAYMTYDNKKYDPIYVVVKHVDEDDCDWLTSDGDELSYWVNITHWKPIDQLTTNPKGEES